MENIDSIDAYKAKLAAAINANRGIQQDQPGVGGAPDIPPQDTQDVQAGAGPNIGPGDEDAINGAPGTAPPPQTIDGQDGAGPDISPPAAAAAPQALPAGGMGGGGGATIDGAPPTFSSIMGNPLDRGGDTPMRGTAPDAPTAKNAKTAKRAKEAQHAREAPDAPDAPTIDGQGGPPAAPGTMPPPQLAQPNPGQTPARPGTAPIDGAAPQGPTGPIDGTDADTSPAAAHKNGETLPDGRPGINVHPPGFDPSDPKNYKKGALEALQASNQDPMPSHVFDVMKPKAQSQYMDWWEKQHGDIQDRYNQLHQDLGTRPDPQRDPTRKEKFSMLMDFGISLLQHSRRSSPYEMPNTAAAGGDAAREAFDRQQGRQQQSTSDYDARNASLIAQKKEEDRDLGNYGQATREDSMIQTQQSRQRYYDDQLQKSGKPAANTFRVDDQGNLRKWDETANGGKGGMVSVKDEKGQPVKEPIGTGVRGGRAALGSGMIQQMNYLQAPREKGGMGMSPQDAFNAVYHQKPSGNVQHDYVSILNKNTPQNATDEERAEAREAAKAGVEAIYGPGAIERAQANSQRTPIPNAGPPPGSLKEGVHTRFGNGSVWTLSNGKPVQVAGQ